jgi:endoglucanase
MIEDGEDNNNQVIVQEGRGGYIYTFLDKAGSTISPNTDAGDLTLAEGGAEGSKYAYRVTGKVGAAEVVYAGLGVNFVDPKGQYDASKYAGISFYAKAGPGSTTTVRLKVPDGSTDPAGKQCSECFNDFGYELQLGTEWQKFTIPFSEMSQLPGWGSPQPGSIDKSTIYGVQFQVNDKGADYDLWFDDIRFVGCG